LIIALFFLQFPNFKWLLPGYAVTALGFVAVIMTIRAEEDWSRAERLKWLFLAMVLMVVEIRVIKKDRDQSDAAQNEVVRRNQGQFSETMARLETHTQTLKDLSQSEEKIENLAKKNLQSITGGNSFGVVVPQYAGGDSILLVVWNWGEYPLMGVTLEISRTAVENWRGEGLFNPISIGNIGPHNHAVVPLSLTFTPNPKSGIDSYWIFVSAQNGMASEGLYFRKDKRGKAPWAYMIRVEKAQAPKTMSKHIPPKGLLYFGPWTDEIESKSN
jgi:hypothetical protein